MGTDHPRLGVCVAHSSGANRSAGQAGAFKLCNAQTCMGLFAATI